MDKTISIAIMLFILSMISERLVTWIKLQFGPENRWFPFFTSKDEDLTVKSNDPDAEKQREKKILSLNIFIGVVVAFAANANFFTILDAGDAPYKGIGWLNFEWKDFQFSALIGWPLTGMFISLGSKFWHDFLDLLLYTKEMKKRLSDPETYNVSAIGQLDYLKFTDAELMQLAIAQNEQALKVKYPGIMYLNDTTSIVSGAPKNVVGVYFKDQSAKGFPGTLPVRLPSGDYHHVATEVVEGLGKPVTSIGLDDPIQNQLLNMKGSACCLLSDDKADFVLTNCHVMTDNKLQSPLANTGSPKVLYDGNTVGTWEFGYMSSEGDFALVKLANKDNFVTTYQPQLFNNKTYRIIEPHYQTLQVNAIGAKSKHRTGYVVDVLKDKLCVEYQGGNKVTFSEVIVVGDRQDRQTCQPITQKGDSGGVLYDNKNNLVGVITAFDDRFSYAIPIHKFLEISSIPNLKVL